MKGKRKEGTVRITKLAELYYLSYFSFRVKISSYHHIGNGTFNFAQRNDGAGSLFGLFIQLPNMNSVLASHHKDVIETWREKESGGNKGSIVCFLAH